MNYYFAIIKIILSLPWSLIYSYFVKKRWCFNYSTLISHLYHWWLFYSKDFAY